MWRATLGVVLTALLSVSTGGAKPLSDYCKNSKNLAFFQSQAYLSENHLGVKNQGGLFDGGVCWWHSLFQRSALYLAVFNPAQPKPTAQQTEEIVDVIATGKQVVEIPGYHNILEFSDSHWPVIQAKLNQWQLVDGFLKQAWVNSVTSTYNEQPRRLKKTMDKLFTTVETNHEITWVMLKFKGFGAHAWLVVDMAATALGYEFVVIDSNYPSQMVNVAYVNGSSSIDSSLGPLALFPGRAGFFKDYKKARSEYCSREHRSELKKFPLNNDND